MKNNVYLDKEDYLSLLLKQKKYVTQTRKQIAKLNEEIRVSKVLIPKLEKECNEFRAFKKGRIWKILKKYRKFKKKYSEIIKKSE